MTFDIYHEHDIDLLEEPNALHKVERTTSLASILTELMKCHLMSGNSNMQLLLLKLVLHEAI